MRINLSYLFLILCISSFSVHAQNDSEIHKESANLSLDNLCDKNDGKACHELARNYLNLGKQNEAVDLLKKSCDLNYFPACNEVGVLFQKGENVSKDLTQAKKYLEKSCENKNVIGCQLLIDFQESIDKDINSSSRSPFDIDTVQYLVDNRFFEIGCELNIGDACEYLVMPVKNRNLILSSWLFTLV